MRLGQRRQARVERRVGVVQILEVDELGDERAPLALGDAHARTGRGTSRGRSSRSRSAGRTGTSSTTAAGMPCSCMLPSADRPGVRMVTLIGSTSTWFSARSSKPCHSSLGLQHPGRRARRRLVGHGLGLPDVEPPGALRAASSTPVMARRKPSASSMVSCTSARPAGCSIIAAATSQEAMIPYCGEVEVCIMNASLKRVMSSCCVSPCCTWIIDACDKRGQQLVRRLGGEGDRVRRARRAAPTRSRDSRRRTRGSSRRRTTPRRSAARRLLSPSELLDRVDVVAKAVIGRVGHHHQADLAARFLRERAGGDLLLRSTSGVN